MGPPARPRRLGLCDHGRRARERPALARALRFRPGASDPATRISRRMIVIGLTANPDDAARPGGGQHPIVRADLRCARSLHWGQSLNRFICVQAGPSGHRRRPRGRPSHPAQRIDVALFTGGSLGMPLFILLDPVVLPMFMFPSA